MLASHRFGVELRRLREQHGLSLDGLARQLSYSKGYLSKVESGQRRASQELARRCDALLGAEGRLQQLAARPAPAPRPDPARTTPPAPGPHPHDGHPYAAGAAGYTAEHPGRRESLPFAALPAPSGYPGLPALPAAELLGALLPQRPTALDPGVPALLREQLVQYRALGQQLDPVLLVPALQMQSETAVRIALRCDGRTRAELLLIAAHFIEFGGWMAQEAGDRHTALAYTERAVELARAGGNRQLAGYALVRRALVTFYAGDAAATVALAAAAQDRRLRPRIRGLAALREAQGHALGGDRGRCLRALERAEVLLATAAADHDGGPTIGSSHIADPAAMTTGWCLFDLGHARRAAEILDREHARIPLRATRARVRYGLRRALAHAAAGEAEHACAVAAEQLGGLGDVPSATVTGDLRRLDRELRRFRANRAVREFQPVLLAAITGC
ncbi:MULTISPECIES: helix-turn-helix transcriptional regulator [Kitasatospora]|uniref:Putative transcriptional regulator n=1 Tax=Kitasatospora setae (strain ATCC 33774 / DSM 43861 / JCM 3304 / KCC A-0304 / NBRC 14216 / KM-6054) TaxID=452652 RepID=E4N9F8_KITSK|nr:MULTISPECIES: helix-turn-helix transcriptional regulator [Kitasatospora]BAJ27839.1 putative transcriptional regulator [Kitasatospora setae KM-6054]